jgi:hypothetical protein
LHYRLAALLLKLAAFVIFFKFFRARVAYNLQ